MAQESGWTQQLQRLIQLQPAVVRGLLVAVTGVIAQILGHSVVSDGTIDSILDAYTSISALVSAFWIRGVVTPHLKVVSFKPDPFASDLECPGPACEDTQHDLEQALSNLDEEDVDIDVPPVTDPQLVQQESNPPVETDNSAREDDGDQSDVSQEPKADLS